MSRCTLPLNMKLDIFFVYTSGLSAGFGVLASQGDQPKKGEKKKKFPHLVVRALINHPYGGDLGPELSPRKCGRFVRATPCQCREVTRFPPSDAQNRGRCEGGRMNHKPQGVSDF